MSKQKDNLRRRAEQRLIAAERPVADMTASDLSKLLYELRLHQTDLELQNEELRKSHEAIEASRKAYQDLWELAPVGYLLIDQFGRITAVNEAAASRILGRPEHMLLKERFAALVVPEERVTVQFLLERVLSSRIVEKQEITVLRPDGSVRTCLLRGKAAGKEATQKHIRAALVDISDRKRAEEILPLHAAITKNMSEGVLLGRFSDGIILYANPKTEEIFGYRPGELLGKHIATINAPTEKSPEETFRGIMEYMEDHDRWQDEIQNVRKDGTVFWSYASVSKFDHPEYGKVFLSVHTEITERKRIEEELQKAHDVLEERVAERTFELEAKRWELEKLNKELEAQIAARRKSEARLKAEHKRRTYLAKKLGELLEREFEEISRGLHEDIGQMLVSIRFRLDLIKEGLEGNPKMVKMIDDVLEGIMESTVHMRNISHTYRTDLIDYLGLPAAIRELADVARTNSKADLKLYINNVPDELAREKKIIVYRIIQEALSNIVRHAQAKNISVSLITKNNTLIATIEDDGIGFGRYNSVKDSSERVPLGTVIMEERAAQAGGMLTIDSREGKGTMVIAEIPVSETAR